MLPTKTLGDTIRVVSRGEFDALTAERDALREHVEELKRARAAITSERDHARQAWAQCAAACDALRAKVEAMQEWIDATTQTLAAHEEEHGVFIPRGSLPPCFDSYRAVPDDLGAEP